MGETALSILVVRAQTGDRQAYDQIVHRFQDMAVGYASALLGDFHLAEDAAQEAFVAAWNELPRLREAAAFPGWLRQMVFARSTRISRARRPVRNDEAGRQRVDTTPTPAALLEEKDVRQWVLHSVEKLPEEERLATALFYISEYTHQQIADFLDLPLATVNNRLRAARKRLKEDMLAMTKKQLRSNAPSRDERFAQRVSQLLQPDSMQTDDYQYGVEKVNGHDAWALFCACAAGDMTRVRALLERDPKLVNAQYWYQFPIHMAVRAGHAEVVQMLLDAGADPGQSRFLYNSWDKLLGLTAERNFAAIQRILSAAMQERFGYDAGFEPLVDAIKSRTRKRVEALLNEHPDFIGQADAFGNGPLHWASLTRQKELIDLFIDRGADKEARRADGQTPILVALNGDYWYRQSNLPADVPDAWNMVQHLLAKGADYILSIACAAGDSQRVEEILQQDPVQARRLDVGQRSPLTYAAQHGHIEIARKLLALGADPNQPETLSSRGGALFAASAGNHLEVAKLLLQHGADANAYADSSGTCITIVEAKHPDRCQPMRELLRQHGAFMPAWALDDEALKREISNDGPALRDEQFLHEVMGRNDTGLIQLVLECHPEMVDNLILTDIWGGNYPADPDIIRALYQRGLDLNRANWIGRTFLHSAAEKGDIAAARTFIELGADIEAVELEFGSTPLGSAARKGQQEMVELLLAQGADARARADAPWGQALAQAEKAGYKEVGARIKQHLARP